MLITLGKGKFILNAHEDVHARAAMEAYADACEAMSPELARRVRESLHLARRMPLCVRTALRIVREAQTVGRLRPDYSEASWLQVLRTLELIEREPEVIKMFSNWPDSSPP
ncbi:hypothetical protein [Pseudomonas chlororaphis]|uniref:hypothetical protein n=1 Tax=Pseudomonas chlororaphis TaxID=587753 RepID=UPI0006A649BE|nr:hypothetical protein [Pseudomonas chlororaphis]AZC32225.1 hypothetical protein C4K38_4273 [Pseudomonas chlororaphis subsp. piscium]AZD74458.1 hypothetical protein C4K16_4106 [Pseudomonas chlororaphis subsp. aurantiaca]WDG89954.1 hypothetical protein PUP49_22045 [Pseudomonas chlororaphis]SDS70455.1 hypothetical protein SAMN05216585_3120 [Pseudomonas chlororaphis]